MDTILVTGGCGFIGSTFIELILSDKRVKNVINLDKITYCANKDANKKFKNYKLIKDDVNNVFDALKGKENSIDYIFHFAAESHVDNSISGPEPFVHSNVNGTFKMVEFAKAFDIPIVVVSTDEVYGSLTYEDPCSVETDLLRPSSVYSSTKASADLIALSYFHTFKTNVKITRCCNNYGFNQYDEKFLPTILRSLKNGKKIPVYGDGKNIREWIDARDHSEAVWAVALKGVPGEIYNIGTSDERSNIELVRCILELWGAGEDSIEFVEDRKGHDIRYSLNCNKITHEIGWIPKYGDITDFLKEAIKELKTP